MCDWLATCLEVPSHSRNLARSNLFFYTESARDSIPSWKSIPYAFPSTVTKILNTDTLPVSLEIQYNEIPTVGLFEGTLSLLRESEKRNKISYEWHRFAYFDKEGNLSRISQRYYFVEKGSEYCLGILNIDKNILLHIKVGNGEIETVSLDIADIELILSPIDGFRAI